MFHIFHFIFLFDMVIAALVVCKTVIMSNLSALMYV